MKPEGTTEIYHLIYTSSAAVRLSQIELIELLKLSRRNNEASGLTGMLIYRDGTYLQFLEGSRAAIAGLLNRLQTDPRHGEIRVLREGILPARMFPDWSMAYKNLAGLRSSNVPGYSELLQGHYVNHGSKSAGQMLIEMFQESLAPA